MPSQVISHMQDLVYMWLQVKMRGADQPPKPTGDPDPQSRPAIQTDPDLTIQTYDPDPFVLSWLDIFFYKVLKSIPLHYKVLLQYYSVLQSTTPVRLCTTKYDPGWSREFPKFGHPVPDLVPDRSRPVPEQFHGIHGQCPFTAMLPKEKKQVCA